MFSVKRIGIVAVAAIAVATFALFDTSLASAQGDGPSGEQGIPGVPVAGPLQLGYVPGPVLIDVTVNGMTNLPTWITANPARTTTVTGNKIPAAAIDLSGIPGGSGGDGLDSVASNNTLSGSGTAADPLRVTTPFTGEVFTTADHAKLDGIAAGAQVNPSASDATPQRSTTSTGTAGTSSNYARADHRHQGDGTGTSSTTSVATDNTLAGAGTTSDRLRVASPFTSADKTKLAGIAAGAEVNVQSDWDVTSSSSDAFIKNKPTVPEASAATPEDVGHSTGAAGTSSDYARADHRHRVTSTVTGLVTVASNTTLDGSGTSGSPLGVANPFTSADETKLDDIPSEGSANANKLIGFDSSGNYAAIDAPTGIMASSAAPAQSTAGNGTAGTSNAFARGDHQHQAAAAITDATITGTGLSGSPLSVATPFTGEVFTTADHTKLDGIAPSAEVNVRSDWNATTGDAQILNKPAAGTAVPGTSSNTTGGAGSSTSYARADHWHRGHTIISDATLTGTGISGSALGVASSITSKLAGIASGAEANVQADWNVASSSSDAFIKNKPTIPTASNATPQQSSTSSGSAGTSSQFARADHRHMGDGIGTSGGGLAEVAHDSTLAGRGTGADQLRVVNPFTSADEAKLDDIPDQGSGNANKYIGFDSSGNYTALNAPSGGMGGGLSQSQVDARIATYARTSPSGTIPDAQIPGDIARDSEIPSASNTTPVQSAATGTVGTSTSYARADHRHQGDGVGTSNSGLTQSQVDARIASYARATPSGTIADAQIPSSIARDSELPTVPGAYTSVPAQSSTTGAAGSSSDYARGDHRHQGDGAGLTESQVDSRVATWARTSSPSGTIPDASIPAAIARDSEIPAASSSTPVASAATGAVGTSTTFARGDHRHQGDGAGASNSDIDGRIATWARATSPSGTIPDGNIPSGITRDTEVAGAYTSAAITGNVITLTQKGGGTTDLTLPTGGDITGVTAGTGLSGGGATGTVTLNVANPFTNADETKLDGIATGAEANVQADWNAASGDAYIKNKPTIPSASSATPAVVAASSSVGTATAFARGDHAHGGPTPASTAPPQSAATGAVGTSAQYARADHRHQGDGTATVANAVTLDASGFTASDNGDFPAWDDTNDEWDDASFGDTGIEWTYDRAAATWTANGFRDRMVPLPTGSALADFPIGTLTYIDGEGVYEVSASGAATSAFSATWTPGDDPASDNYGFTSDGTSGSQFGTRPAALPATIHDIYADANHNIWLRATTGTFSRQGIVLQVGSNTWHLQYSASWDNSDMFLATGSVAPWTSSSVTFTLHALGGKKPFTSSTKHWRLVMANAISAPSNVEGTIHPFYAIRSSSSSETFLTLTGTGSSITLPGSARSTTNTSSELITLPSLGSTDQYIYLVYPTGELEEIAVMNRVGVDALVEGYHATMVKSYANTDVGWSSVNYDIWRTSTKLVALHTGYGTGKIWRIR